MAEGNIAASLRSGIAAEGNIRAPLRLWLCLAGQVVAQCRMAQDGTKRRRWIGGVSLGLALVMVVAGERVVRGRIGPGMELLYWLLCFLLTGVAIVVALLDFRALKQRILAEQRELVEKTLKDIQGEAQRRPERAGKNGQPARERKD